MTALEKIFFQLKQDSDGYPPIAVESLWAQKNGENHVLDNIPFFFREATLGDVIQTEVKAGVLWFGKVLRHSGNSLLRAVFFDENRIDEVREAMTQLGCSSECLMSNKLLAINVPPEVDLGKVQSYLKIAAEKEWLDYEEPILRQ